MLPSKNKIVPIFLSNFHVQEVTAKSRQNKSSTYVISCEISKIELDVHHRQQAENTAIKTRQHKLKFMC